ncbi:hypothetical protein [Frondihabitans peucedani]|uniref:DUF3558 domain-containing protein n=1 Tax=Frondihabitans peucedani TaxID=598626 RepID=A0ABP8DYK8_9MICO
MTAASGHSPARLAILRRIAVPALALASVGVLSGCTGTQPGAPTTSAAARPAPSATPTGGAGALDATAFSEPCDQLVPETTIAASYAGMTALTKAAAPAKSDAAVIGAYGGTVCTWKNAAGTTMTLAVGRFSTASLTKLKNSLVVSSNPVPTYRGEGYFDLVGDQGTAEAFTGDYWVVATSADPTFGEPGGAEPLVDAAIASLSALSKG